MKRYSQFDRQRASSPFPILIIFSVFISLFFLFSELFAKPVNSLQAEKVVKGWLKTDAKPLGMDFWGNIKKTDGFNGADGQPVYYIVHFEPIGFVIVSADDFVEPIVGFVRGGKYDPSPTNPLGALVSRDLPGRVKAAHNLEAKFASNTKKNNLTSDEIILREESSKAKGKWEQFQAYADSVAYSGSPSVSDVRVMPLVLSQWNQENVCGGYCYNYYTPNNYLDGCVATAMAQLMRFYQWPKVGIGAHSYTVEVDGISKNKSTRGGNGSGGAYNWSQMTLVPDCDITETQRQAIGAICYDAGVASYSSYGSNGTVALYSDAKYALTGIFKFSNAIMSWNNNANIGSSLNKMINPNLDAGCPVMLGIAESGDSDSGHAVIADGYGYSSSTLYHHINLGWGGYYDAWYNLPSIPAGSTSFTIVDTCIYNIFTSGSGEIISGRVTDASGNPINVATVTAVWLGGTRSVTTNSNGIYAFKNMPSYTSYTVSASKRGFSFADIPASTGSSSDWGTTCGNVWGANFQGPFQLPTDCNDVTFGSQTGQWDYPMHAASYDSRTQVIYLASEINTHGTISGLTLNIATKPSQVMENWTIRMKHTNLSSYGTASFDASGWTTVYRADESIGTTGWRTFWFTTPFEYNGNSNLLIDFSHHSDSTASSGSCFYFTPGGTRSAYASSNGSYGDPLNWSDANSPLISGSGSVPDLQLMICHTPWKFGTYDALINKSITVKDADGAIVTFGLTGGGWGQITDDSNDFGQIILQDTVAKSAFTIKTASGRKTSVGDIVVHGQLKSISATTTDLGGNITIDNGSGQIQMNDVDGGNKITIGPPATPLTGVTMKFDEVNDLNIDSDTPIKLLACTQWRDNDANKDYIKAPSVGTLQVKGDLRRGIAGDLEADLVLGGNSINSSTLTSATIAGSINGSTWDITGNVKTIYVKGDVNNWDLATNRGDISSLKVGRVSEPNDLRGLHIEGKINSLQAFSWLGGVIEANAINTLTISGKKAVVRGDFHADVNLPGSKSIADVGRNTLGSAKIAGKIIGGIWDVTGNVGSIQLGSSEADAWVGDFSGSVNSLKATGYTDIDGTRVAAVLSGDLSSKSLKSVSVTGDISDANITLNQVLVIDPKITALGSMKVTGWIDASRITSVGNIGSITTGGIRNSSCFAGDIAGLADDNGDGVLDLPDPLNSDSLGNALIGTFTVKGMKSPTDSRVTIDSVINSNIAARNFNTVLLTYPQCDNSGKYFGVAADYIKKLTIKDANGTVPYPNLTGPNDITPHDANAVIRVR